MNTEEIRSFCLSIHPSVTEDFPFDESTLTFRIGNKIFALLSLDAVPPTINLKCDPEKAIRLREENNLIIPGYHMNKTHWNSITDTTETDASLLKEMISDSYTLIKNSLPKKIKDSL
ncbi:MmcQ/YjbR family DNA-binding protein [Saccharicrinis sp. FJH62]|uniref:MmcQ/YjbR family DNA-binding protein n=1 Tax=Saccharicrinis sp. FJH62 TaxID=3344657 RepID=UPI0035D407D2